MSSHNTSRFEKSLLWYFFQLIVHPNRTIQVIIKNEVSLKKIAWTLAVVGALRGVVEGTWMYGMQGKWLLLTESLKHFDWYVNNSLPFIVCNIPSTHFLWLGITLCLYVTGKLLGGLAKFSEIARIIGIAMISYVIIGILNYAYLVIPLPSLSLHATYAYSPRIGVGQFIVLGWLIYLMFLTGKNVFGIGTICSVMGSVLPIILSLVSFQASALLFFKSLQFLPKLTTQQTFVLANFAYTITIIVFIPIFIFLGLKIQKWLKGWSLSNNRQTHSENIKDFKKMGREIYAPKNDIK